MQHNRCSKIQFYKEPVCFNKNTERELLQYCLGGTLYMPSTRKIAEKIVERSMPCLTSMVMCFEDAISSADLPLGESNVVSQLDILHEALTNDQVGVDDLPLIFLRVRDVQQFVEFSRRLERRHVNLLSGFVFPKFYSENAYEYLELLENLNQRFGCSLYGMPILEGDTIAHSESRIAELDKLKLILNNFKDIVLNIRIGGTDFSSLFGLRRSINTSIYDILVVRDIVSDILNIFNRVEDGYVVSSPVWEYFLASQQAIVAKREAKNINHFLSPRDVIFSDAVDGLLKEVLLDKANGMVGKTVIHPTHLKFVNAMQAVTLEEYCDAKQIVSHSGGVLKSENNNKMNEIGPHFSWAKKVMLRAKAYGVIESDSDYFELFKE